MTEATKSLPAFTLAHVNAAIESMASSQLSAVQSIARVIVMAVYAANVGFPDKAGKLQPTPEVANALFANLRKGMKKSAVQACLEEQGNLAYVSGTWVSFAAGKVWDADSIAKLKEAANNWENYKPATVKAGKIDAIAAFDELVAKLMKASKAGELENAAELVKMQGLLATMKADAFDLGI